MKTPEEIKKGLECYITQNTGGCDGIPCRDCPHYDPNSAYTITACKDALAYIRQLEREKAVLLEELSGMDGSCEYCKNAMRIAEPCDEVDFDCEACENKCPCGKCQDGSNWQWSGLANGAVVLGGES